MKNLFIVVAALFFFCASAFGQDYVGTLNNAPYKIRIPGNWNGELLVYAHGYGYLERWDNNQFNYSYADAAPGGAAMEDFLLAQGYALAGTTFRGAGWQVKEGTIELVSLAGLFSGLVGKPKKTILIGYSMGSVIALKSAEEVSIYDGVIAGCTAAAGTSKGFDLGGAFALAYKTAVGWPDAWGPWYDVRDDLSFNREVLPVLYAQATNPVNTPKFEFIRRLFDLPIEGFYEKPGWLFLDMFFTTEIRAELEARAKGPVVQNVDQLFTLSDAAKSYLAALGVDADGLLAQMNAQTNILAASPQRRYLEKYFDPSGDLQKPVISIHASKDGLAPAYLEPVLLETVKSANKENLLLQVFTDDAGHCTFTPVQLLSTIKAMDSWLNTGMKPGPDFFPATAGFIPGFVPGPWPIGTKIH
jgi:pimeloyl-ACP methyl ester carboxylesterase